MASITCPSFFSPPLCIPKSRTKVLTRFFLSSCAFLASFASFNFPNPVISRDPRRWFKFSNSPRLAASSSLTLSSPLLLTTNLVSVRREVHLPIPLGMKCKSSVLSSSRCLKLIRFPNPRGNLFSPTHPYRIKLWRLIKSLTLSGNSLNSKF
ncbi:hypothetical protein CFOL_v3_18725 [Cephalotus follicularis]|uniref:Uncharacterized protein n=1 Tax=Cephalotus follicularis TaxID=3775 RepID=A0A1Q3C4N1_CEPFO|nr:hypothetical protein CFOL_v3_18725 [Cephalotus follicularis]